MRCSRARDRDQRALFCRFFVVYAEVQTAGGSMSLSAGSGSAKAAMYLAAQASLPDAPNRAAAPDAHRPWRSPRRRGRRPARIRRNRRVGRMMLFLSGSPRMASGAGQGQERVGRCRSSVGALTRDAAATASGAPAGFVGILFAGHVERGAPRGDQFRPISGNGQ